MINISIIICTYNRADYLPECFESLKNQDYSKNGFEVVLINNNSKDHTEEISKKFQAESPDLTFNYYIEEKQGLSNARNKGIEVAQGDIIAFIDDDARAETDYISNMAKSFENNTDYISVGGKVLPIYPNKLEPAWMSDYLQRLVSKVDYGNKSGEFYKSKYPVGCNMAFRKEFFKIYGSFNTDLTLRNDDKFIFHKLKKNKEKIFYAHDVVVHHHIDQFRLEPGFIKELARLNGSTERIRMESEGFIGRIVKPFEYLFKFGAAILIGFTFLLKGQAPKGKTLVKVMWNTFLGYTFKAK